MTWPKNMAWKFCHLHPEMRSANIVNNFKYEQNDQLLRVWLMQNLVTLNVRPIDYGGGIVKLLHSLNLGQSIKFFCSDRCLVQAEWADFIWLFIKNPTVLILALCPP